METGYYPAGTEEDPEAPWNQKSNSPQTFDITVFETLSKKTDVTTDEYEYDEDSEDYDTSNVSWLDEYSKTHYTLYELLKECIKLFGKVEWMMIPNDVREHMLKLKKECEGWIEEEIEFVDDE